MSHFCKDAQKHKYSGERVCAGCFREIQEAVRELLEVLTPFYLHAKAIKPRADGDLQLNEISKFETSVLVVGAFASVMEVFKKFGVAAGFIEKRLGTCLGCDSTVHPGDCQS